MAPSDMTADVVAIMDLRSSYGDIIDRLVRNGPNARDETLLKAVFTADCVLAFGILLGLHRCWGAIMALFVAWHPDILSCLLHSFIRPLIEFNVIPPAGLCPLFAFLFPTISFPLPSPFS